MRGKIPASATTAHSNSRAAGEMSQVREDNRRWVRMAGLISAKYRRGIARAVPAATGQAIHPCRSRLAGDSCGANTTNRAVRHRQQAGSYNGNGASSAVVAAPATPRQQFRQKS
ncbi:hypothetical protein D3C71_1723030 [compost metagenome]